MHASNNCSSHGKCSIKSFTSLDVDLSAAVLVDASSLMANDGADTPELVDAPSLTANGGADTPELVEAPSLTPNEGADIPELVDAPSLTLNEGTGTLEHRGGPSTIGADALAFAGTLPIAGDESVMFMLLVWILFVRIVHVDASSFTVSTGTDELAKPLLLQ